MALTVLIAGASRGIGLELARRYAKAGAHVIGTARDVGAAEALKAAGAEVLALDVASAESAAALAAALAGRAVHLLVCNAGVLAGRGGMGDAAYTADSWRDTLVTNVFGPFNVTRALAPALRRGARDGGGGRVAVVSSVLASSTRAAGSTYSYCASKAAATNVAFNLAAELAADGIAVAPFHPGWVATDMGGQHASVSVGESAAGLMARFDEMSVGAPPRLMSYTGEEIPL